MESWQIIVAQVLQATFVAIVMGNGLSYFSDFLPHAPGVAATFYANATTLGRLGGSLTAGFGAQLAGFRYVNWICVVIVVISFLFLILKRPRSLAAREEIKQSNSKQALTQ